jgi:glycosyltransferase involved in cell wall biosynthesis
MTTVFIVSPTESVITTRGKRHPNLASYLVSKDIDVFYITSTINHAEKRLFTPQEVSAALKETEYKTEYINAGIYYKNISIKRVFWNFIFSIKVFLVLIKYARAGDVLVFPSRPPELMLVARILKMLREVKLFLDVEDIWPDAFLVKNRLQRAAFYSYCNLINKLSISSFDAGVHVSPNFKAWLERYSPSYISEFAPLGITQEDFKSEHKKYYKDKSFEGLKIFYGGTLSLQFDILPLIKAISQSTTNFKIVLAGDSGDGDRFEEVMSCIKENCIDYEFCGLLDKKAFINKIGQSDIVVVPMISGGLPKKFFDAMGSIKPVLCLGSGGVAQEVVNYNLGWVAGFDENEILALLDSINRTSLDEKIENVSKVVAHYLEENSLIKIYSGIEGLI